MGLSDDLKLIRAQLETHVREAWAFAPGNQIYLAPMEVEPSTDKYAVIERGAITEDYETAGTSGHSRLIVTYNIYGSFRRPPGGQDRDAVMVDRIQAIRDKLNDGQHYADIATMHICRQFESYLGEGSEPFDRLGVTFEVVLIYTRTG